MEKFDEVIVSLSILGIYTVKFYNEIRVLVNKVTSLIPENGGKPEYFKGYKNESASYFTSIFIKK